LEEVPQPLNSCGWDKVIELVEMEPEVVEFVDKKKKRGVSGVYRA
jgi:hypothetical protein